ncbi:MAG TPA: peptidoglycan DD-metalloendopeptidase family protein [Methylomusa anaerophila]|uniref:Murein hydrolase activator NlpD n=1 Tax=Methylomusa anaerophila TaxID=1930071 RepID=A0A348AJH8_9FIRM|nr:M23 family metallopeptidase [Methylomusa anaerophila]BBB91226.1 murein hydrolase activator NlpD precursor [Methylomusa anaerophila]HML89779.1 peptidoglycan DD-metalloendopeptidase family protein [Methylomusa anaerophila]
MILITELICETSEVIFLKLPKLNAKQWACVGGVVLMAGAGAWGIAPLRQNWLESGTVKQLEPESKAAPPVPVPEPATAQPAGSQATTTTKHVVAEGETLSAIAARYNIDLDTLLSANPGVNELIHAGDELVILPQKGIVYEVDSGDSLWWIANTYGVDVETIIKANNKKDDLINIGEKLFIPGARYARAATTASRAGVSRFVWPTNGELSSPFGWRWGRLHEGVDIANDVGTHVMAARSGRVVWTGWRGGYGYTVMIDHGSGFMTLYGHLDDFFVQRGQFVRTGQRIASMGNTGNSTGPHLHFEVIQDGQAIDPMAVLP